MTRAKKIKIEIGTTARKNSVQSSSQTLTRVSMAMISEYELYISVK